MARGLLLSSGCGRFRSPVCNARKGRAPGAKGRRRRVGVTPGSFSKQSWARASSGSGCGAPAVAASGRSETQPGGGGHHRRVPGVDGGDDLFGVDALQVDRGRAEVRVAELTLDHVQRHAFARELDGVGVAQLVRREATPDTRLSGEPAKLYPRIGA